MKMKKRVKSLLLAILMVFTILPSQLNVGAEDDDVGIYLKILDTKEESFDAKKIKLSVYDSANHKIEEVKYNLYKSYDGNIIDINNLIYGEKYKIIIGYDSYLNYKNALEADYRGGEYQEITLEKDTFTTYAFSSDTPDSWRLNESTPYISTNISSDALAGFSQTFYSSDKSIADVDSTFI